MFSPRTPRVLARPRPHAPMMPMFSFSLGLVGFWREAFFFRCAGARPAPSVMPAPAAAV